MNYGLHLTCCIAFMRTLASGSVHLIICDSPYANTNLGFDKQPVDWPSWLVEAKRVLAKNGVIICFAAESFTLDLIASNREWYRYRRVWVKTKASRYLDKDWRPLCAHEDIIVFAPAIKEATYNPQKVGYEGPKKDTKRKAVKQSHYKAQRYAAEYVDDGTRYPTTVMEYASVGSTAPHFNPTAKPLALIQELVLTYSNEGDTVLEPFAGDAPTAHACQNTGRLYYGCEVDLQQYEWSQAHLAQSSPLFTPTHDRLPHESVPPQKMAWHEARCAATHPPPTQPTTDMPKDTRQVRVATCQTCKGWIRVGCYPAHDKSIDREYVKCMREGNNITTMLLTKWNKAEMPRCSCP